MLNKNLCIFLTMITFCSSCVFLPSINLSASTLTPNVEDKKWGETNGDGLYSAVAQDGVMIRMRRYRPTPESEFRINRQPIIIFPGILENINQFFPSKNAAPDCEKKYKNMKLRTPLADWAKDDMYIKDDPMLYFSIAQYLWDKGYDPWFVNYRGIGRGVYKSDRPDDDLVTLDSWAVLDTPAAISRVIEVTGLKPIIGGHSTGGLVSYIYLQGVYIDNDELLKAKREHYKPHVKSSESLAKERNNLVRGVIALDPAAIPPMPSWLNNNIIWGVVDKPKYLPIADAPKIMNVLLTKSATNRIVINLFDKTYYRSSNGENYSSINESLNILNTHDKHPNLNDWLVYHVLENTYTGTIGQYLDFCSNNIMRENWQNGKDNLKIKKGPVPKTNDSYHNYMDDMNRVSVPFIMLLSQYDGLVKADQDIKDIMEAKSKSPYDKWFVLPNTGHMNVYEGYSASMVGFPMIGEWLQQVIGDPIQVITINSIQNTTVQ